MKGLAEFTLALVLFSDSANANLAVLRKVEWVPVRLLLIGLPLTIAAGVGVGYLIFDDLTLLEVALLATMLAPTDAALGQAVVTNETVPSRRPRKPQRRKWSERRYLRSRVAHFSGSRNRTGFG